MKPNYKNLRAFLLKIKASKKLKKEQKDRAINSIIKMYKVKNRYYNERIGFYPILAFINLSEMFIWDKTVEGKDFWKFIHENS